MPSECRLESRSLNRFSLRCFAPNIVGGVVSMLSECRGSDVGVSYPVPSVSCGMKVLSEYDIPTILGEKLCR